MNYPVLIWLRSSDEPLRMELFGYRKQDAEDKAVDIFCQASAYPLHPFGNDQEEVFIKCGEVQRWQVLEPTCPLCTGEATGEPYCGPHRRYVEGTYFPEQVRAGTLGPQASGLEGAVLTTP